MITTANTIKFSDVCLELYGSTSTAGKTLLTAHTYAAGGTFNGAYDTLGATKTLLDFRGYYWAPTVPTGLVETADTNTTISMSWNASTDNVGISGYEISIDGGVGINVGNVLTYTTGTLACNATYGFRVRAYDARSNYSAYSSTVNMATNVDTVTTPTGLVETADTNTTISMTWGASSSSCGFAITNYYVSIDGGADIDTGSDLLYTTGTLACNTTYGFRVRAKDSSGVYSSYSTTVNMTTNVDTVTVPTSFAKTSSTDTTITMTWGASSSVCGTITNYYISVDSGADIDTGSDLSHILTGLACNATSYSIRVRAKSSLGNYSAYSSAVAMTTSADTTIPTVPTSFAKSSSTDTTITMTWVASTDTCSGINRYEISINDGTAFSVGNVTSYQRTGLACNATSYNFKIRAVDGAGNIGNYTTNVAMTTSADTTIPTVPTSFAKSSSTDTTITMTWVASTDNCTGINRYEISINDGTAFSVGNVTSYQRTGLTCNATSYNFKIRAVDGAGNVGNYTSNVAMTTSADTTVPTVPTSFAKSSSTNTAITMTWVASTDNCTGINRYEISINDGTAFSVGNVLTYQRTGLTCNTSYNFKIRAVDGAGNIGNYTSNVSMATNVDTVTVPTGLAIGSATSSTIPMTWGASSSVCGTITNYYISINSGADVDTGSDLSHTITGLPAGTTYSIRIRAKSSLGNYSAYSSAVNMATTPIPTAPTTLNISAPNLNATSQELYLSWLGASDAIGIQAYKVYISVNAGAYNYHSTVTTTSTSGVLSYALNSVNFFNSYSYKIITVNTSNNDSALSAASVVFTPTDYGDPTILGFGITQLSDGSLSLSWTSFADQAVPNGLEYEIAILVAGTSTSLYNSGTLGYPYATSKEVDFIYISNQTSVDYIMVLSDIQGNTHLITGNKVLTVVPPVPTGLAKDGSTYTTITMIWNSSWGASSYNVSTDNGSTWSGAVTSPYTASGLTCGATSYNVKVRACNVIGCSVGSSTVAMTTTADTTAPTQVTGIVQTAGVATTTSVRISWNASTDDCSVVNYRITNNGASITNSTSTNYTYTGLVAGSSYIAGVQAYDGSNNFATNTILPIYTLCIAPTLSISSKTSTSITNTWNSVTGASSYVYEYKLTSSSTWLASGDNVSPGVVTGLIANTSYDFRVRAINSFGEASTNSTTLTVVTTAGDTTGPTAPVVSGNLIATFRRDISFDWSAAYDASGVENYYIERRINGGAWSLLTSVGDTVLSYTDTSTKTNGNTYSYRVIADDIYANMGTYSNIVDTKYDTTPPSVATTINGLEEFDGPGITISPTGGSDSFSGVLHYKIWRSTSGPTSGFLYVGTTSQLNQTWFDSYCAYNVQYWYKAETVDVAGNLSGLSSASLYHMPVSGGK